MIAKAEQYQAVVDGFSTVVAAVQKQFFARRISYGDTRVKVANLCKEFTEENPELCAEFRKITDTVINEIKQEHLKRQNPLFS